MFDLFWKNDLGLWIWNCLVSVTNILKFITKLTNQECTESRCSLHSDYEGCYCQVAEDATNRTILCHTCCKKIGMFKVMTN